MRLGHAAAPAMTLASAQHRPTTAPLHSLLPPSPPPMPGHRRAGNPRRHLPRHLRHAEPLSPRRLRPAAGPRSALRSLPSSGHGPALRRRRVFARIGKPVPVITRLPTGLLPIVLQVPVSRTSFFPSSANARARPRIPITSSQAPKNKDTRLRDFYSPYSPQVQHRLSRASRAWRQALSNPKRPVCSGPLHSEGPSR